MKQDLQKLLVKLKPVTETLRRFKTLIVIFLIAGIYAFLIIQINLLNSKEPSDADVSSKLTSVTRPKIDQETIDKIKELQDNSVEVKALFNNARDNPFQE